MSVSYMIIMCNAQCNAMVSKLSVCGGGGGGGGGFPGKIPSVLIFKTKYKDIVIQVCSFVRGYSSISWSVGTRLMYVLLVKGADQSS